MIKEGYVFVTESELMRLVSIQIPCPLKPDCDNVPVIQRGFVSAGHREPAYTDVVLALYKLLMLPDEWYTSYGYDARKDIVTILKHCSNHQFGPFIRLTNSRHNPNAETRLWAINELYAIAHGEKGRHQFWKKGAIHRLNQLAKQGALSFPWP